MDIAITVQVPITVRFDREAGVWVAGCPPLAVYSQGTSEQQAVEAAKDALTLFLRHCYQRKILDNVLVEHGFRPVPEPAMFTLSPDAGVEGTRRGLMDVPLFLVQQARDGHKDGGPCPS